METGSKEKRRYVGFVDVPATDKTGVTSSSPCPSSPPATSTAGRFAYMCGVRVDPGAETLHCERRSRSTLAFCSV